MSTAESQPQPSSEEILRLIELMEIVQMAQGLEDLAEHVLPGIIKMTQSSSAFLYIVNSRLPGHYFFQCGFQPESAFKIEKLCTEQFDQISSQTDLKPDTISYSPDWKIAADLMLYLLKTEETYVGLMGLTARKDAISPDILERFLCILSNTIFQFAERTKSKKQLSHLNNYLTVSSMIAQSMDLHELLEITLHCCIEAVSAEAASVLILDDEKKNFCFYHVEGPTKSVLMASTFPADQGIAGSVLEAQKSEIINDVHDDPRFYGDIDSEYGFQTRNMIAIPLLAGEEKIGVLEVLNKTKGASFTEDEYYLLLMIAEEIAFAIRNAMVFEYVVNTYCKQRQGQASCKGCKRPLGSWTPCVKYREADL